MANDIAIPTRLKRPRGCVVRPQEQQYLVYNPGTDELHLLEPIAFYIVRLCDEPTSIDDLEWMLEKVVGAGGNDVRQHLHAFVRDCVARGILEGCDA